MAVLPVYVEPHEVLRKIAAPVAGGVTDELRQLMDDMVETMHANNGIGLAAPQVGVSLRIFVLQIPESRGGDNKPLYFVNPEITASGELVPYEEGCLSVPGVSVGEKAPQGEKGKAKAEVMRPKKASVSYLDRDGNPRTMEAEGCLLAVALQHETDHLDGKLFIDHLSVEERDRVMQECREYIKSGDPSEFAEMFVFDQPE
ncbi:MAG: peptide deformylase [Pseudomonadota bacterium]